MDFKIRIKVNSARPSPHPNASRQLKALLLTDLNQLLIS